MGLYLSYKQALFSYLFMSLLNYVFSKSVIKGVRQIKQAYTYILHAKKGQAFKFMSNFSQKFSC